MKTRVKTTALKDRDVVDLLARYFAARPDGLSKNVSAMNLFGRRFPEVLEHLRQRPAYHE